MKFDPYLTLGVSKDATEDEIRRAFRSLANAVHPDKPRSDTTAPSIGLTEVIRARDLIGSPSARQEFDRFGSSTKHTHGGTVYEIGESMAAGAYADARWCRSGTETFVAKISRSPSNNDLIDREAKMLRRYLADIEDGFYLNYVTWLVDTVQLRGRRGPGPRANIFKHLDGWYTLEQVRERAPGLQFEHGVWIFNRLLEFCGALHKAGLVHANLTPDNVMVYSSTDEPSPWTHGVKVLGWSRAVTAGSKSVGYSERFPSFYPSQVKNHRELGSQVDISMAARCAAYVLGGDQARAKGHPEYLISFLETAGAHVDARALLEKFKAHMAVNYGPKQYVRFSI